MGEHYYQSNPHKGLYYAPKQVSSFHVAEVHSVELFLFIFVGLGSQ